MSNCFPESTLISSSLENRSRELRIKFEFAHVSHLFLLSENSAYDKSKLNKNISAWFSSIFWGICKQRLGVRVGHCRTPLWGVI